jgi:hypothetical protein
MSSGVACQCSKCPTPQWYASGKCQGCGSGADVAYTWVAHGGGVIIPPSPPADTLQLQSGVSQQLIRIWTNMVLLRSLTPVQQGSITHLGPRGWFHWRGLSWNIRVNNPPADLNDKINSAADWTNQAFIIRLAATFEAFADGKKPNKARLPNNHGMREYHHIRRLRNAAAHGDELDDPRDVSEETQLFRGGGSPAGRCNLAINEVLEPMWARGLLYAKSLEKGASALPPNPAVVAVAKDNCFVTQSFAGKLELNLPDGDPRLQLKIGDVIGL